MNLKQRRRLLLTPTGIVAPPVNLSIPVLDQLSVASAGAFSPRRLRAAHTGSALALRRSQDSAVMDVGFTTAGDLDSAAMLSFVDGTFFPLNLVSVGAAAAFSLRRLLIAYAGACLRVRRSSDSAQQDIGFDAYGRLDIAALLAFVGSSSGFVTVWYDQSGNARNVSQTNPALQPRIVNAGVLETENGRPTLQFPGTATLTGAAAVTARSAVSVFSVDANGTQVFYSAGGNNITAFGIQAPLRRLGMADTLGTMSDFPDVVTAGPTIYYDAADTLSNEVNIRNGVAQTAVQTISALGSFSSVLSIGSRLIGGASPLYMNGRCTELILFADVLSDQDRVILEEAHSRYYGISYALSSAIASGFVQTWYDQSGNNRHVTQTNPALQPRIVNAGVYSGEINFNTSEAGNQGRLFFASTLNVGAFPYTTSTVLRQTAGAGASLVFGNAGGGVQFLRIDGRNPAQFTPGVGYGTGFDASVPIILTQTVTAGNAATGWANGVSVGSTTSAVAQGTTTDGIGTWNAGQSFFAAREVMLFAAALSPLDRVILERNQGAYHGIPVA